MSSDIPKTSGIYRITCIATGKFYIGSAVNLQSRRRIHFHHLRHNTHGNSKLQRAWNKYGEESFTFEVIEYVLPTFLLEREQYWFDMLGPFGNIGFNIDRVAGSRIGSQHTLETREKLRLANLGKKQSEELIRKRTRHQKGRKHNAAMREKVRLARLGTRRDPETRERLRISHLGKKHEAETIKKMSAARLGHDVSPETRAKISASNVAHPTHIKRMKTLIATAPDGTVYVAHGIGKFCREHNLNRSALAQVAKGNANHHKGWTARYAEADDLRLGE